MLKNKRIFLIGLMFILSIALVACGDSDADGDGDDSGDGDTISIKFAHEEGQDDVQDLYANKFKETIEEKSDGKIEVDVYTAGTLGTNMDALQSLQTGAIEMAITSPGFSGDVIPESNIMSVPFCFQMI